MVGVIKSYKEININLLESLFEKRGYQITIKDYTEKIIKILEGKEIGKVVQCKCGDLLVIMPQYFDAVKKSVKDNKWCKRCRLSSDGQLDFSLPAGTIRLDRSILRRTAQIEQIMKEFEYNEFNNTRYCPLYRLREVNKLGDGLFPANNIFEFLYGYAYFGRDWLENIFYTIQPHFYQKFQTEIDKLIQLLLSTKNLDVYKLLEVIPPEKMNSISTPHQIHGILTKLKRKFKEKNGIYDDSEKDVTLDYNEAWAHLTIDAYNQSFEIQAVLDLLKNIDNILSGKTISSDPFKGIKIPGKKKKIRDSKADQVEFLVKLNLPIGIKKILEETYDNRLRNALFHNELKINTSLKRVELIKYNETRSFEEIGEMEEKLMYFQTILLSKIQEILQRKLIDNYRNFGIVNVELTLDNNNPSIKLKQYTYFTDPIKKYFPVPNVLFSPKHKSIEINFGTDGFPFYFPYEGDNKKWLESLFNNKHIFVEKKEIAPLFLQYKSKSKEVIKLNWETCFVISIESKKIDVCDQDLQVIKLLSIDVEGKSPLSMNFDKKIEMVYDYSELKKLQIQDLQDFSKDIESQPSLKKELKKYGWTEELVKIPENKKLKLNLRDYRIQEDIFLVEEIFDTDYALYDLALNQIVCVEKRNLKEELKIGDYIWARIISFTYQGIARLWDFIEAYRPQEN